MICPKTLQEETVGVTTRPVTQVEVVAVKSASKKEVGFPSAELMGSESNTAPINIVIKKLSNMICVVDTRSRCFFILSKRYHTKNKCEQCNGFAKTDDRDVL